MLEVTNKTDLNTLTATVAYQILTGFDKSFRWYCRITGGAQQRFEQGEWQATQQAVKERITIYEQSLSAAVSDIYHHVFPLQQNHAFWQGLKSAYLKLLDEHPQFELAETFYNSVIGRIFKHQVIDNSVMFILPSRCFLAGHYRAKVVNSFDTTGTVRNLLDDIFKTYRFNLDFAHKEHDLALVEQVIRQHLSRQQLASIHTIEMLKPVFYRSKSAYLVGRICMPEQTIPFVIALMLDQQKQLQIDAILLEPADLSVIFGFARAYFMADTQHPAEVVAFLHELLPNKKHFELYISLGLYKHGKTVFYRNFLQHMEHSDDQFTFAPGIRGLVMSVFHLPSYGVVFKIIKDHFPESKKVTRERVKECYRLVKMTDRVGRMADTHEYMNFRLPLNRMDPALLQELQEECAGSIEVTSEAVIIKHLYIERKMTPLNLYLEQETDPDKIRHAIDELGLCIKQIAAANIFAGDMLHKNFGITRHGRVIFYDYDEICYMHEREFRLLPRSDDPYALDTLSVGPTDVFPEQFEHFIVGKKHLKLLLKELHGDLMTQAFWLGAQEKAKTREVQYFWPYSEAKRLINQTLTHSTL
ncbi:MAG: bifunctional isocitrate dehydrogenase kinase/phosphatase [Paraglaciecola sp.]|uniref:bifunctional isocitrate dehydrogenase kinase/phosphatase n=1 Tax=Paraglaciecola sp. TaxID=1920173 RepID=UPI00273DA2C5|nr:bifunctional isocitrate dehydrogenase kinase/phosphatase [Paraglaciecola sp.]MDP5032971.1 bifunctional isocitrate dehydrogenase kinase/phosphatase [Paraglaciecola sp.]MDP5133660.1 bifunctional isocitrate dehydrogenase kinase/phosphatase [Paraglaciecola sp.]